VTMELLGHPVFESHVLADGGKGGAEAVEDLSTLRILRLKTLLVLPTIKPRACLSPPISEESVHRIRYGQRPSRQRNESSASGGSSSG
jgi:hypothetical protein